MNAYPEGFAVSHGDVRLPDWLMKMDISKGAKLTYNVLAICSRGRDYTWPSQGLLASHLSSSIRTVQRHLAELMKHGLIEKGQENVRGKIRRVYRFLTGHKASKKALSQQCDKMPSRPAEPQKILSRNTTKCREKSDKMSCAHNKVETIKEKYPPTPQMLLPVTQPDPACDLAGKVGDFYLESKEEDPTWGEAKKVLEKHLSPSSFQTWIAPLLFEQDEVQVVLHCPNSFFLNWVKTHFSPQIKTALESVGLTEWQFDLFTPEQQKTDDERKAKAEKLQKETAKADARSAIPPDEDVDALPLEEQFKRLYAAYPRNYEGMDEAQKAFYKLYRSKKLPQTSVLIAAIKRTKTNNQSWLRNAEQYAPQLEKWLYKRRWLD